jgi:glucose-6-phosphate 1-dehydrogenase
MAKSTEYHQADVTADGPLAALLATLEGPVAVYFALPPQDQPEGLRNPAPGAGPRRDPRLVMEKPFGSGEESARELNRTLLPLSRRTTSTGWTISWARPPS